MKLASVLAGIFVNFVFGLRQNAFLPDGRHDALREDDLEKLPPPVPIMPPPELDDFQHLPHEIHPQELGSPPALPKMPPPELDEFDDWPKKAAPKVPQEVQQFNSMPPAPNYKPPPVPTEFVRNFPSPPDYPPPAPPKETEGGSLKMPTKPSRPPPRPPVTDHVWPPPADQWPPQSQQTQTSQEYQQPAWFSYEAAELPWENPSVMEPNNDVPVTITDCTANRPQHGLPWSGGNWGQQCCCKAESKRKQCRCCRGSKDKPGETRETGLKTKCPVPKNMDNCNRNYVNKTCCCKGSTSNCKCQRTCDTEFSFQGQAAFCFKAL